MTSFLICFLSTDQILNQLKFLYRSRQVNSFIFLLRLDLVYIIGHPVHEFTHQIIFEFINNDFNLNLKINLIMNYTKFYEYYCTCETHYSNFTSNWIKKYFGAIMARILKMLSPKIILKYWAKFNQKLRVNNWFVVILFIFIVLLLLLLLLLLLKMYYKVIVVSGFDTSQSNFTLWRDLLQSSAKRSP